MIDCRECINFNLCASEQGSAMCKELRRQSRAVEVATENELAALKPLNYGLDIIFPSRRDYDYN